MTSQPHLVQPPRIAVWLISLFALAEEAESILGDLLEEFSALATKSGIPSARIWYWRQTIKTVPRLAGLGFRTDPWMTATAVVGGFLLRKLVAPLVGSLTFAVIERYQVFFEHHFSAYLFFASTGLDIEHLITFLLIGFIVAFAAREREMVATMVLGFIFGALAVIASVNITIRFGYDASFWRFTWYFSDALAIVFAGAIVRTRRLAAASLSSKTYLPAPAESPAIRKLLRTRFKQQGQIRRDSDGFSYPQLTAHTLNYLPVPPTVILSSLVVGMSTPTGILWPSLPQLPMPSSSLGPERPFFSQLRRSQAQFDF
jgi:hypothetical protein